MGAGIKAQGRVCYVLLTDYWACRHVQEVRHEWDYTLACTFPSFIERHKYFGSSLRHYYSK